ncbi:Maf family protein [Sphingobacterium oryzagri]|uniref:dTTP/UTP pyrophosphatase n=1 Tax=Sphingobacterium oryzagri TaxID=3025669 RepID=A0ABY7WHX1_9SPHI|nr:Maf family protein [Sphingobacterium sp. KACC 22765]WDF68096.1 Maf family protein [Sphingobacterium sp. KACC 22765]
MLIDKLSTIRIVLGSQSPRRKELLGNLGIDFQVLVKETDESFDPALSPAEIVKSIAINKLLAFDSAEFANAMVITADTVVVFDSHILGKPKDNVEAIDTLMKLQGNAHQVMTAVALAYKGEQYSFVETTDVNLYPLTFDEIQHYVNQFLPLDKAGSYGIQEWFGLVGIQSIQGSYENVVGLPTARLYQEIKKIVG